ncbi:SMC-Scp complex subunit ScpB [Paraglaciecola sp. MB-3u-78]|jgi:segregation and condensation protein B|uniref:SMC-Scp complex subunit ScpB n=1 Tax=Paraglaciecola sp. MB-3u-78 TaxID=2058332 RepID=UPI000C34DA76|nr:SMC-Scp complex subunit ScpB [Paraglaciecola sp. MB-3u-78]PKG97126.1 SMC-Scp complex subunit ScpB [Paraglaciecola sp. MB-3u-78]
MAKISRAQLKQLVEAAIFVADQPLSQEQIQLTVLDGLAVSKTMLKETLTELKLEYQARGIQLVEVASGYRFQSMDSLSPWLSKLWQEQAPRYSRAMLEILSLIAYRQPITRGEIEDVRGVSVSSQIMKTLSERGWVKVIGHKEVPGRPSLYATTKTFLDYFSLKSLSDLPSSDDFLGSEDIDNQLNILSSDADNRLTEDNPPQKSADRTTIESNIESNDADEPEQLH